MALFGDTVSREHHDTVVSLLKEQLATAQADLAAERTRFEALVVQTIAIKRHEHGMMPQGFDPATLDPMAKFGPQTTAAIEEIGRDGELRNYLINFAHREYLVTPHDDREAQDEAVAERIRAGDTD